MKSFKQYLVEALTDEQYKTVNGIAASRDQKDSKGNFVSSYGDFGPMFNFDENGRMEVELKHLNDIPVREAEDVELREFLRNNEYEIVNWKAGLCKKINSNQIISIGKVLQKFLKNSQNNPYTEYTEPEIEQYIKIFAKRLGMAAYRKYDISQPGPSQGLYLMVITKNPADIAGMSTGKKWNSCTNLNNGAHCRDPYQHIKFGFLTAYLVLMKDWLKTPDDKKDLAMDNALARASIKRKVGQTDKTAFIFEIEDVKYGETTTIAETDFEEKLKSIITKNNIATSKYENTFISFASKDIWYDTKQMEYPTKNFNDKKIIDIIESGDLKSIEIFIDQYIKDKPGLVFKLIENIAKNKQIKKGSAEWFACAKLIDHVKNNYEKYKSFHFGETGSEQNILIQTLIFTINFDFLHYILSGDNEIIFKDYYNDRRCIESIFTLVLLTSKSNEINVIIEALTILIKKYEISTAAILYAIQQKLYRLNPSEVENFIHMVIFPMIENQSSEDYKKMSLYKILQFIIASTSYIGIDDKYMTLLYTVINKFKTEFQSMLKDNLNFISDTINSRVKQLAVISNDLIELIEILKQNYPSSQDNQNPFISVLDNAVKKQTKNK